MFLILLGAGVEIFNKEVFLFIILIDIGCKFVVSAKLRFCWKYFNYIILICAYNSNTFYQRF